VVNVGDMLFALGSPEALEELEAVFEPRADA
jgi:hypothetical protein